MDSAIDGFESQALDILFLSETHLNLGNNVDLTCLNRFDCVFILFAAIRKAKRNGY